MAPHNRERKRHLPDIEIPPLPRNRPVPGPNAFAIAARAEEAERQKQAEHDQLFGADTFAADSRLPRSNSINFFANLIDQARASSPRKAARKSDHSYNSSSVASHYSSTARSKHSERSYRSTVSDLPEEPTQRGEIEAQNERKLLKIMGEAPETPKTGVPPLPDSHVKINDLRPGSQSSKLDRDVITATRSPKKKIFGVSIPFSKASTHTPAPPMNMPRKVARVLGTSPPRTRKFSPQGSRTLPHGTRTLPRADTSKSLPSKVYNQPTHPVRRRSPPTQSSSRTRPSHRSPTSKETPFSHAKTLEALTSSPPSLPPTPPKKDSPAPETKVAKIVRQLLTAPPKQEEVEDFEDRGMKLLIPVVPKMNPIPSGGGESPSKFCPNDDVEDQGELMEGDPIQSSYGKFEYARDKGDGASVYSAPLADQALESLTPRPGRRSGGPQIAPTSPLGARLRGYPRRLDSLSYVDPLPREHPFSREPSLPRQVSSPSSVYSPQLEYLPATVYVPPKPAFRGGTAGGSWYDKAQTDDHPLFLAASKPEGRQTPQTARRGSIGIIFQGEASEIESPSATATSIQTLATASHSGDDCDGHDGPHGPHGSNVTARIMEELRINQPNNTSAEASSGGLLQSEPSHLTAMLSCVRLSGADFPDYAPNCSSAVPSPLHGLANTRHANAPHPMLVGKNSMLPPMSGVPMHDHFFMTNEHIDVVGCTLYDYVSNCSKQQTMAASSKHDQLKSALEQEFNDIKSQVNSISEKADHTANQNHNITIQLDKLLEFIKSDVVEPLATMAQKTIGMEQSIKELQKGIQELQKSSLHASSSVGQTANPLPTPRSQPHLSGFWDSNNQSHGPMPQIPSGPSDRRYGNNTQLGRPGYGRENRENNHPFSNTNPYHSPGASFGNNFAGGYHQALNYSMMPDQQAYAYQGPPK